MERKYELQVITPILAGYNKNLFGFRIFAKIDLSSFKIIPWNFEVSEQEIEEYAKKHKIKVNPSKIHEIVKAIIDEKTEDIEKSMTKLGFVKIDYLFPRKHYNLDKIKDIKDYLEWIDWWFYFSRPLKYLFKHNVGADIKVLEVIPKDINFGIQVHYYSATQSPVYYESVNSGSKFEITVDGSYDGELEVQIGRRRAVGYGKIRITPL